MPRDGSGVYSAAAGSTVTAGTTIESAKFNAMLSDLVTDANTARPIVAGGTGATTAAGARTALGLDIGTNVQAYDAGLTSIAGLTTAADRMIYTTASDVYAVATLTAAGRALLDDADAAAQLATLGAQPAGATLTSLEALSLVAGDTLYATAADTLTRLPKGTAGQVLRMNGGATAPEWAQNTAPVLLASKTASASATLDFTEFVNATYSRYRFVLKAVLPATNAVYLTVRFSTDAGATYEAGASAYVFVVTGSDSATGNTTDGSNATTAIRITPNNAAALISNTGQGVFGSFELFNAPSATLRTRVTGQLEFDDSGGDIFVGMAAGKQATAADTDALRFLMSSGNITSGTIEMWGLI